MHKTILPLLLLLAACGTDAPSGPSAAERIEKEQVILAQHRDALKARVLLMISLFEEKPAADPAMRAAKPPVEPAPSYLSFGPGERNVFFFWAKGSTQKRTPFPGDRIKLLRLYKRARSESPPDKPWDGDLEKDIAHVLSRHVAIAIPIELTMPEVPEGDSGEFKGGSCRAELRFIDGETMQVLATGFCEASSSDSLNIFGSKNSVSANTSMRITMDFSHRVGVAMSRAFNGIVGGSWKLGFHLS